MFYAMRIVYFCTTVGRYLCWFDPYSLSFFLSSWCRWQGANSHSYFGDSDLSLFLCVCSLPSPPPGSWMTSAGAEHKNDITLKKVNVNHWASKIPTRIRSSSIVAVYYIGGLNELTSLSRYGINAFWGVEMVHKRRLRRLALNERGVVSN